MPLTRKKTHKKRVLARYPYAFSTWRSLYGEWHVYMKPEGRLIGIGDSPIQAWANAVEWMEIQYVTCG